MDNLLRVVFCFGIISSCLGQYYQQEGQQAQHAQPQQYYSEPASRIPPAQILSHKQALNHDGNFKYAFAAENGLAQGETIAPDGSRIGGYSYVDPLGKKISIKYTAGKDGFRILEGDHIPRVPLQGAPAAPQVAAPQPGVYDDGQYRPQQYTRPAPVPFSPGPPAYTQVRPVAPYIPQQRYVQPANSVDAKEPEYNDEPGKPHSFGAGYAFEFAG